MKEAKEANVVERRAWTSTLVPTARGITFLAMSAAAVFGAGFGAYPIVGVQRTLPDSVQALSKLLQAQAGATTTVNRTVSGLAEDMQAVEVTLDTFVTTTADHATQIRAVNRRVDEVERGITTVVHEIQRIRCLARIAATGEIVSPLAVDDRCP